MNMTHWITATSLLLTCGCTSFEKVGDLGTDSDTDSGSDSASTGGSDSISSTTGDTDGSDSDSASASGSSSASASATATTTDGTSDTASTGSGGETEGSTGEIEVCVPDGDVDPYAWVTHDQQFVDLDVSTLCMVTEAAFDPGVSTIALDCGDIGADATAYTIEATVPEALFDHLAEEDMVHLNLTQVAPFWVEQWFELRTVEGELLLGGAQGSTPVPSDPQVGPPAGFFSPLGPSVTEGECPVFEGGDGCGVEEPLLVDFGNGDLVQGSLDEVADAEGTTWEIQLGDARHTTDIMCTDYPPYWYEFVIANVTP